MITQRTPVLPGRCRQIWAQCSIVRRRARCYKSCVAPYPIGCPPDPDETIEAYCMNALSPGQTAAFEEHLLICTGCQAAVLECAEYVDAMRSAARAVRGTGRER